MCVNTEIMHLHKKHNVIQVPFSRYRVVTEEGTITYLYVILYRMWFSNAIHGNSLSNTLAKTNMLVLCFSLAS